MKLLVFGTVGTAVFYFYWRWKSKRKLKPLPPGPSGLSAIFTFMKALNTFTLHLETENWTRQFGNIVCITILNQNIIFLNDHDLARSCYCEDNRLVTNDRPATFASTLMFKNENIGFSQLGTLHTRLRKLFHGSLKQYGDGIQLFEDTIMEELRHVVMEIDAKRELQIDDLVSRSLLNVIHILLTNRRPDDDGIIVREMREYNTAVNRLFGPEIDSPLTLLPFLRYIPGPFKTVCDNAVNKTQNIIRLLYEPMKAAYTPGEPHGLIQAALEMQRNLADEEKMTEEHVKYIMMEIISAGYLTTKGMLLGVLMVLIENPDLQERVYKNIIKVIGDEPPLLEHRPSLPLVDAIVLESARYLTHGPFALPHRTRKEIELNGYRIPKDSTILSNFWTMGHDESVWEDPWTFRPERFLGENGELLPADHPVRLRFSPFGVGRRQCPGEVFAKTRLVLFIATLIQHFKFLPPDGGMKSSSDPRTWTPGIILQPENVWCRVVVRDTCPLLR